MVTIELSKEEKLVLPESLGRSLGLREGDRVKCDGKTMFCGSSAKKDRVIWGH